MINESLLEIIRPCFGSFELGFWCPLESGIMGSSVGEPRDKVFNPSAGDLVWVRQNNGSWWPGQVVGLDELLEISAVPRRTGTPVMLLGRKNINM